MKGWIERDEGEHIAPCDGKILVDVLFYNGHDSTEPNRGARPVDRWSWHHRSKSGFTIKAWRPHNPDEWIEWNPEEDTKPLDHILTEIQCVDGVIVDEIRPAKRWSWDKLDRGAQIARYRIKGPYTKEEQQEASNNSYWSDAP